MGLVQILAIRLSDRDDDPMARLPRIPYETELLRLQGELVQMQEWVRSNGARLVVVFEGRDAARKLKLPKRPPQRGYERPPRERFHEVPDHAATLVS